MAQRDPPLVAAPVKDFAHCPPLPRSRKLFACGCCSAPHCSSSSPPLDVFQVVCSSGGGGSGGGALLGFSSWRRCGPRAPPCWSAAAPACQVRMWREWRPRSAPPGMTALWRSLGFLCLLLLLLLQPPSLAAARLPTAPPAGETGTCVQLSPTTPPTPVHSFAAV